LGDDCLGGLLFKTGPSNLQHVTALSFLLVVYGRYMEANKKIVNCGNIAAKPCDLINLAKSQVINNCWNKSTILFEYPDYCNFSPLFFL